MNEQDLNNESNNQESIVHVSGMYQNWFLDYASYVILERAVPHINDGLKPVQRRILHSLKEMNDGRFHKVANVIGHTMKYHPHGDASIGDAMVQVGQKDLLLDMQGNWGNVATGDRAAAPRYIEVRLTSFAVDVVFNKKNQEQIDNSLLLQGKAILVIDARDYCPYCEKFKYDVADSYQGSIPMVFRNADQLNDLSINLSLIHI